jgi:putative transposase
MPDSLEALDLLLVSVAASRRVRRDGIHFQGLRYMDPTLAVYVGEAVTIRYDPRDITEIRVFHRDRFLCRAISPEHADRTISLKDIEQARTARRRALRADIATRTAKVAAFLPQPQPAQQTRGKAPVRTKPKLSLYKEDRRP